MIAVGPWNLAVVPMPSTAPTVPLVPATVTMEALLAKKRLIVLATLSTNTTSSPSMHAEVAPPMEHCPWAPSAYPDTDAVDRISVVVNGYVLPVARGRKQAATSVSCTNVKESRDIAVSSP
jgi:hypothetical protein